MQYVYGQLNENGIPCVEDICLDSVSEGWNKTEVIKESVAELYKAIDKKKCFTLTMIKSIMEDHPGKTLFLELRESYRESREDSDEYNFNHPTILFIKDNKVIRYDRSTKKFTSCRRPK